MAKDHNQLERERQQQEMLQKGASHNDIHNPNTRSNFNNTGKLPHQQSKGSGSGCMLTLLLGVVLSVLLSSCGGFTETLNHSSARKNKVAGIVQVPQFGGDKGTLTWAHYDVTKRGSMIYVDPEGNVRVLAENPPDAAIQSITEISAKVEDIKGGGSVEAALKTQRSIAELGKRTAAVNMMRDALYRLNEMYYSSVDRTNKLLTKRDEYITKFGVSTMDKTVPSVDEIYPFTSESLLDQSSTFLQPLFEKVIDNTKEIAVEEAQAEIRISEAASLSEVEKSKAIQMKYDALMKVFESVKDDLSADEKKKYLEAIQAIGN